MAIFTGNSTGMSKRQKQNGWLTHVFFITLFLVVPTLATVRPPNEPFLTITRVFVQDTIANGVLLCFFYLNYYVFIPRYYFRRQYAEYAVCVVFFLGFSLAVPSLIGSHLVDYDWNPQGPPMTGFPVTGPPDQGPPVHGLHLPGHGPASIETMVFDEFRRHLYLFFSAIFFSFLLKTREHLSELKEEKVRAELSRLKSQINPHFLFNTLNSIYVLSMKRDDKAPSAIINLSGLMRYVIKDAEHNKIPLAREIDYIKNYIDLQRARLGETTHIEFECSGNAEDKDIAPLLLITYIENAFKYGVNPDVEDCLVEVRIGITDTQLTMYVFNRIVPVVDNIDSTGIGIANTSERLHLLYPGKHTLDIRQDMKTYSVTLSLELV
jgi:hypothetical protein